MNNFCLGYLYNQSGLIDFQQGFDNSDNLKRVLKFHIKSIVHFYNAEQKRWILKGLVDLCVCFYAITLEEDNSPPESIDIMIDFLKKLPDLDHIAFQYKHNINLILSKFLLLKGEDQSLEEAKQILTDLITHHENEKQYRALGAEKVILGELQLLQSETDEGIEIIKNGLDLLNNHKQVQIIALYEVKKISDILPPEPKQEITKLLANYSD